MVILIRPITLPENRKEEEMRISTILLTHSSMMDKHYNKKTGQSQSTRILKESVVVLSNFILHITSHRKE